MPTITGTSTGTGSIKSVQKGEATVTNIASGVLKVDVLISSVDTAKAIITVGSSYIDVSAGGGGTTASWIDFASISFKGEFIDKTTLRFTRSTTYGYSGSYVIRIPWQVVEFN